MYLSEILPAERIHLDREAGAIRSKNDAIRMIAEMLAPPLKTDGEIIERLLLEREQLQSTGIGDRVAIPHTSLQAVSSRAAALLLCPQGVPFDSIDGQSVTIILGVAGPKQATSEHLRVLARISRLLRDASTREALVQADSPEVAYRLIETKDREL